MVNKTNKGEVEGVSAKVTKHIKNVAKAEVDLN